MTEPLRRGSLVPGFNQKGERANQPPIRQNIQECEPLTFVVSDFFQVPISWYQSVCEGVQDSDVVRTCKEKEREKKKKGEGMILGPVQAVKGCPPGRNSTALLQYNFHLYGTY